jgi:hypothetical protein
MRIGSAIASCPIGIHAERMEHIPAVAQIVNALCRTPKL